MTAELKGQPGELRMTISVRRAATGKVENYELVGRGDLDEIKQIVQAADGTQTELTKEHKA